MKNYNLFFDVVEPNENLKNSILSAIKKRETTKLVNKIFFDLAVLLVSASVAILYFINLFKDFYQSGLSDYLSLIFSDGSALLSYWQSYLMSVVESFPIIPIAIILICILAFIWSLNALFENYKGTRLANYKMI